MGHLPGAEPVQAVAGPPRAPEGVRPHERRHVGCQHLHPEQRRRRLHGGARLDAGERLAAPRGRRAVGRAVEAGNAGHNLGLHEPELGKGALGVAGLHCSLQLMQCGPQFSQLVSCGGCHANLYTVVYVC